nr:IVa2 protein [Lemur mastadenovirus]
METKARKRKIPHQPDEPPEDAGQHSGPRPALHRGGDHADPDPASLEGHDSGPASGQPPADPLLHQPTQPAKPRNLLDPAAVDHISELWDKLQVLQQSLSSMPFAEGLKPLKSFDSLKSLLSLGGNALLGDLMEKNKELRASLNSVVPYLQEDGSCRSLNFSLQPLIGVIYGPTGCGKSQLLRNLMSTHLISPAPETIFFITPQIDMVPPQEIMAWQSQICEGNYKAGPEGTIIPQSGTLLPRFVKMSYADLTQEHNYDVTHPDNVFARAASKGPIAIIMDECMEELGKHKGIAKFFHAFPSKLHDRFPKCTGYTVLVVLHNMNPRKDLGGNIANLKIQAKMHILSPKMHPSQITRFINTYTKGLPLAISLLLKDIFNHHSNHSQYDWIIYNTCPEHDALQWLYLHPREGLMPMYLNVQAFLYSVLEKIHRTLSERERWTRYYHAKKAKFIE